MASFDGINLVVTTNAPANGVLEVDVQADLYKPWKDWQLASPANRKFPPLFEESFGGDNITSVKKAAAYFKFRNDYGWRLQASDHDQTISVIGNLLPANSGLPITITRAGRTVMWNGLQPVTQVVNAGLDPTQAQQLTDILADTADMQPKFGTPVTDISADISAIPKGMTLAEFLALQE